MSGVGLTQAPSSARPMYAPGRLPVWPAASIALLLVLAGVVPAGLVTIMDVCLLFLAAIVWITSGGRLPRPFYGIVLPYLGICIVGLASGIGADIYLYLKDAWYVCNPALVISVGYTFYRCKPDLPRVLRAFVIGGALLAVLYITPFFLHPDTVFMEATRSRELVGTGYYAPALAIMILAACRNHSRDLLRMPAWIARPCAALCLAAIVLSFSRTIFIATAIGLLANHGLFSRRAWVKLAVIALALVGTVSVVRMTVDLSSLDASTFLGKLGRSLDEMSIHEYVDLKHINASYRGYESARTLHTYESAEPWQWAAGQGFGALVDLKLYMPGVGRYIPIMHNGYLYLLFKAGVIAILLFLLSLWRMFALGAHAASSDIRVQMVSGRLMQGIALGLAVTTWVISGVFNKLDLYPFLLCAGALCGHLTNVDPIERI